MTENTTKKIAANAVVAALYFVLTIALGSLSYQAIQFRIAECLMLLCFFRKDFTWGLTIGCFLANLASPVGWPDWVFGTLATFLSCGIDLRFWRLLLLECHLRRSRRTCRFGGRLCPLPPPYEEQGFHGGR